MTLFKENGTTPTLNEVGIVVQEDIPLIKESPVSKENIKKLEPFVDSKKRVFIRLCVFIISLSLIVIGRYNVPENSPTCVVDKLMNYFQGLHDLIMKNTYWRDTMQIICSLFMDSMFITLGVFWIYRGVSSRLIVAVICFYTVRAIVQSLWFSPFTPGFWWYDPGFPSLVVPYGKGSDFFFSGHAGFITICASEWNAYGKKIMVYILTIGGIYTCFILLVYQVHYSIDLFTGVIFGHWVFMMIDQRKDSIDNMFWQLYLKGSSMMKQLSSRTNGN